MGNTKAGTKELDICKIVLQLILKGRYRNETEKQVQEGRQVIRLLRKERRKQN